MVHQIMVFTVFRYVEVEYFLLILNLLLKLEVL